MATLSSLNNLRVRRAAAQKGQGYPLGQDPGLNHQAEDAFLGQTLYFILPRRRGESLAEWSTSRVRSSPYLQILHLAEKARQRQILQFIFILVSDKEEVRVYPSGAHCSGVPLASRLLALPANVRPS